MHAGALTAGRLPRRLEHEHLCRLVPHPEEGTPRRRPFAAKAPLQLAQLIKAVPQERLLRADGHVRNMDEHSPHRPRALAVDLRGNLALQHRAERDLQHALRGVLAARAQAPAQGTHDAEQLATWAAGCGADAMQVRFANDLRATRRWRTRK